MYADNSSQPLKRVSTSPRTSSNITNRSEFRRLFFVRDMNMSKNVQD